MPKPTHIIATGSYLPKRVVTNNALAKKLNTNDAWIQTHIGIKERRFAAKNETVSDMALHASKQALKNARLKPKDLDAIIFATTTPEFLAPGSGVLLQHKLGCKNIPAFDVRNTSPGFISALDLADGLIKSGRYTTVLVVASELHSTKLDLSPRGRLMSVIFGDGAGAVILSGKRKGLWALKDAVLHSDGKYFDKLWCESLYPDMDGPFVFKSAVASMTNAVTEIFARNNISSKNITWFLFHQANLRIIEAAAKKLKIPMEKVPAVIQKYGNTSSASIPILLDELLQKKKIKTGQKIILTSFGSGFTWGSVLLG